MKISENTEFKIDIKTVIGIIMFTTTIVGMYYTLQEDIAQAKTLPPVEVTRLEYELKEKWNEDMIIDLKERVDMLEQVDDVVFEEINVISTLIKDVTENDGKLEELNRQLEELRNLGVPFGFKLNAFVTTNPKDGYTNNYNTSKTGNPNEFLGQRKDLIPEKMGNLVKKFKEAGATILGGCCETTPQHIREMSRHK